MKIKYIALTFAVSFFFSNCGNKGKQSKDPKINGNSFQLISGDELELKEASAEGTGEYIYSNENKSSTNSFTFSFKLLGENSSVKLIANSDRNLKNGASLDFMRSGNELKVKLNLGGNTYNLDSFFSHIDASSETLSFALDVHNEDPTHFLIWEKKGNHHYHDHDALYNSEKEGISGKVSGKYWGFKLEKAQLIAPEVGEPKLHHHHH